MIGSCFGSQEGTKGFPLSLDPLSSQGRRYWGCHTPQKLLNTREIRANYDMVK